MQPISEQRRYTRREVLSAVMITPNGDQHPARILDLSVGGARMDLPAEWTPSDGSALRVFFLFDTDDAIALEGRVTRLAVDHLGVEFAPAQEERIRQVLDVVCKFY